MNDNQAIVTNIDKAHSAIKLAYDMTETNPSKSKERLTYAMGLLEAATEYFRPVDGISPELLAPRTEGAWDKVKKIVS